MLEEIIHSCYTGLGDCVIGFVSCFLLKTQLERWHTHQPIRLSLAWIGVSCPYINPDFMFRGRLSRRKTPTINCLYSGTDGTLAFSHYYHSPRLLYDISRATHLRIIINQYIGKCLIDAHTSREEIKELTYQAYRYFWTHVIETGKLPFSILATTTTTTDISLCPPSLIPTTWDQIGVIYLRVGDLALCQGQDVSMEIRQHYQRLSSLDTQLPPFLILLGDVDHHLLQQAYQSIYGQTHRQLIPLDGVIRHSSGPMDHEAWRIIFRDLFIMSHCRFFINLTNSSNFPRIVLFLRSETDTPPRQIYFDQQGQLVHITDLSIIFPKHYRF
uniref:Uncharacterized protein n=1 Tax=viral metagenome TaxID=1070528 RepID=A0A6C0BJL5_9ZZZZ